MALVIPNIDRIAKENPRLAEALLKVQQFSNQNVTPVVGNRIPQPIFVDATQRPG